MLVFLLLPTYAGHFNKDTGGHPSGSNVATTREITLVVGDDLINQVVFTFASVPSSVFRKVFSAVSTVSRTSTALVKLLKGVYVTNRWLSQLKNLKKSKLFNFKLSNVRDEYFNVVADVKYIFSNVSMHIKPAVVIPKYFLNSF